MVLTIMTEVDIKQLYSFQLINMWYIYCPCGKDQSISWDQAVIFWLQFAFAISVSLNIQTHHISFWSPGPEMKVIHIL